MLYAEVMNDDGQDAAVHRTQKKPNIFNTEKLRCSIVVKLKTVLNR